MELKGESLLRELAGKVLPAAVEKIYDHVYFFSNFGGSNATLIIGDLTTQDYFELSFLFGIF